MTKKLASVLERVSKLLHASRGRRLQRHGDLAHQFALVAPLGGGAIVTLQALHLAESDDGSVGAQPRRFRSPAGMGLLVGALIVSLSLGQELNLRPTAPAQPEASAHVAKAARGEQKRALRPITAGLRRPTQTADRDMQLAASNPAAIAITPPRDARTAPQEVVIDVIVAYTKAAASSYEEIVGEAIEPAIAAGNESFRLSGIGHI